MEHEVNIQQYYLLTTMLGELFKKYNVSLKELDSYVHDQYIGVDRYLTIDGKCLYIETVDEMIDRVIKQNT